MRRSEDAPWTADFKGLLTFLRANTLWSREIDRRREAIGHERLMQILEAENLEIEAGDMVCIHTGFADTLMTMNRRPDVKHLHETGSGLDGRDAKLLNWIVDVRLACLIADNQAVELVLPRLGSPATPIATV